MVIAKVADQVNEDRSLFTVGVALVVVGVLLAAMQAVLEKGKDHVEAEMAAQRDFFTERCNADLAEAKEFLVGELDRRFGEFAAQQKALAEEQMERQETLEDTYEQGYRAGSRDSGTVPFPGTNRNDVRQ